MTNQASLSLDALRERFKEGAFDQTREGLEIYLATHPDAADALTLQRHLDNLDVLQEIDRAVVERDWARAVQTVQAAIGLGLTWDLALNPLDALLESVTERRAQPVTAPGRDPHETLSTVPTLLQPDALMEQLVGTILKRAKPQLAEAIRLCAVPFWFDLELLSALRESDDGLDEKILARMARFSFVQQDDRGCYTFSEDVRRYLLAEWDKDREGFARAHRRAQAFFELKLKASAPESEILEALIQPEQPVLARALVGVSSGVGELLQNYLYHSLAVDGDAGIVLLRKLFHAADEAHRLALAERYLEVANEQRAWLNPEQRAHLDYMRGLLHQLQGRWDASRDLFERMLDREGLPATLQARLRRALGDTLIQQEQWVEAITLCEIALRDFRADDDTLESALTMISLGRAHLDLALNTWGGGEAFSLRESRLDKLRDLVQLVGRLPISVYLMSHLGVRALLPVLLRVGQDMDWLVARLFVTAADWFNRADGLLRELNDREGLSRVEENLAWLYLLLGHAKRSEALYRRLLAREGVTVGEYRAARARLGLAEVLVRQRRLDEARELLEQILPVFGAYRHPERIAQTHTALAQTYALKGRPDQAVTHYRQAVERYQQLGDDANVTEVVEQMQLLQDEPTTDADTRETIATVAARVPRRRYLTRFSLSLLYIFRLLALAGLTGVILFSLFTSIRLESSTGFSVEQALLESRQTVASPFEPVIELDLRPQLQSSFDVDFALYLILVALGLYLILYTLLGLWLTMRTPLRTLQEAQRFDIIVDAEGVGRGAEDLPGSLQLQWNRIAALLSSDRCIFRDPIPLFSRFALFGAKGAITVEGQTRRYPALRDLVEDRLNASQKRTGQTILSHDFGFSIFDSRWGWLFVGTLIFILAFVVAAQVVPQSLIAHLGPLPYSLSDLYGISYLGLLIPVGWWLVVQPLRERLFLKPHTRRLWLIGLVGLLLAAFTLVDLGWLRLPIGRPNVAPGLFAAFLLGISAYYVWNVRRWDRMPFQQGDHVYSLRVRLVSSAVALLIILVALGAVGREVVAYHYLALASQRRQWATDAQAEGQEALAQQHYQEALSFYDRALGWVGNDAETYHTRGTLLTQLGRYREAIPSLQQAVGRAPNELSYRRSLAMSYDLWANARRKADDVEDIQLLYDQARDQYTRIIERSAGKDEELKTLYLLRAGDSFQLAKYYEEQAENQDIALRNYQAARKDYQRVIELEPHNAAALTGLGWAEYKLSKLDQDLEAARERLGQALAHFEGAAANDPEQVSAWTGQGYAHFAIGRTYAWWDEAQGRTRSACADSARNPATPEEKRIYTAENLEALDAFDQAATLAPQDVSLHNLLGRVRFVLLNCPGIDDQQLYLDAIQDYTRAIQLEPDNSEWYQIRANFYYLLGPDYYDESAADYETAVSLEPNVNWYWTLGNLYWAQGERDQALEAYSEAVELAPDDYSKRVQLGWNAYRAGDYERSAEASRAAATLDPTDPRPFFNEGLALVAMGDAVEARSVYREGIAVAEALVDAQKRISRYEEARADLDAVFRDPADIADALRARLTLQLGLTYARLGLADETQAAYEAAIEIAETLSQETRRELYDRALEDLRNVEGDAALVKRVVELLQAARER